MCGIDLPLNSDEPAAHGVLQVMAQRPFRICGEAGYDGQVAEVRSSHWGPTGPHLWEGKISVDTD